MPCTKTLKFTLASSTPEGRRADNNQKKDPNNDVTLNSVVDPRSVFVEMQVCGKVVEAVCDCGASVSCLSPDVFENLKANNTIELKTCKRKLRAANGLPIEVKGVITVPVKIAKNTYEHDFCVLDKSEADCLLGLDFLEKHKCDPLFSRMELKLDSGNAVPLYHKQFNDYGVDTIFRVVASETLSVPSGHVTIIPAYIPSFKRPPVQLCAVFEPKEKFDESNELSAPNVLFDLTEEVIPVAIDNRTDNDVTIYKDTTLGFSEIVPPAVLNSISHDETQLQVLPAKPNKYDLNLVKKSVVEPIPRSCQEKFARLVDDFQDIFSKSEWD